SSAAARQDCALLARGRRFITDVGPDFYAWAAHEGDDGFRARDCASEETDVLDGSVRVISPRSGDVFVLLEDLPRRNQTVPVRLHASAGQGSLEVRVNGRRVFDLSAPFEGRLDAEPGQYLLSVHHTGSAETLARVRYQVTEPASTPRR